MTRTTLAVALLISVSASAGAQEQPICSANPSALERLICRDTTLAGGGTPQGGPPATPLPPPPPPPQPPQPPTSTGTGTLYVSLRNIYDANLRAMGIAGVLRAGVDQAHGMLTWNEATGTYEGVLSAFAGGSYQATTLVGNCGDQSAGAQSIYAVGHVEPWQGQPSYLAPWRDSVVVGRFGPEAIVFYFFPQSAPQFTPITTGRCQQPIQFEGYGGGGNRAPHPWLPQVRGAGRFLPFNDTRWTTQNGLIVRMPPPHEWVNYWDLTQVLPAEGANSRWDITVVHGGHGP